MGFHLNQTLANNLTCSRYLKITQYSAIIRGQIPGRIGVNDSTRAKFEYLRNGQIMVQYGEYEASQVTHVLHYLSRKWPFIKVLSTRYSPRGWVTRVQSINDLTLPWLRTRPCAIQIENEPWVGTPSPQNLILINTTSSNIWMSNKIFSIQHY